MAQVRPLPIEPRQAATPTANAQKRGPSIHQIYALPAPIRTFPLPTFYPNNPISLFHVLSAWLGQVFSPPPAQPAVVHHGLWSEATSSVHVTDEKSMRALWEQGFYGKGSLSRSEPNWLKREEVRRGLQEAHVSEILTVQRRQERAQAKWERARLEQEAIQSTRLKEARETEARRQAWLANLLPASPVPLAPVGPLEILALPNSAAELSAIAAGRIASHEGPAEASEVPIKQNGDALGDFAAVKAEPTRSDALQGRMGDLDLPCSVQDTRARANSAPRTPTKSTAVLDISSDSAADSPPKRRKSVRFSPKVQSTTYQLSDPPSPDRSPSGRTTKSSTNDGSKLGTRNSEAPRPLETHANGSGPAEVQPLVNREHLQLTPEEALFLSFGLGTLRVSDPISGLPLSTKDMLTRFRQHSYFPPRTGTEEPQLSPDDGFLLHYAVYHHFRSLGWVPRAGIKFGVDWLLYTRGPVFDHAEFGLVVLPSYMDPWWQQSGKQAAPKSWAWLHGVVRVLSHVTKSLVLVYVDVPPPSKFEKALEAGLTEALKLYKIREVMVKRWSSNRNR